MIPHFYLNHIMYCNDSTSSHLIPSHLIPSHLISFHLISWLKNNFVQHEQMIMLLSILSNPNYVVSRHSQCMEAGYSVLYIDFLHRSPDMQILGYVTGRVVLLPLSSPQVTIKNIINALDCTTITNDELIIWLKKYFVQNDRVLRILSLLDDPNQYIQDISFINNNIIFIDLYHQTMKTILQSSATLELI